MTLTGVIEPVIKSTVLGYSNFRVGVVEHDRLCRVADQQGKRKVRMVEETVSRCGGVREPTNTTAIILGLLE